MDGAGRVRNNVIVVNRRKRFWHARLVSNASFRASAQTAFAYYCIRCLRELKPRTLLSGFWHPEGS